MTPVNAGIFDKVLKGGLVGAVVDATAPQIDKAINTLTAKHGLASTYATKVVPIVAFGVAVVQVQHKSTSNFKLHTNH